MKGLLTHGGQARASGGLRSLHWHPGGRFLAVAGHNPALEIIDVEHAGERVWAVEDPGTFSRVRWSPDGTRLALVGAGGRPVEHHDAARSAQEALPNHHNDVIVYDLAASEEILAVRVRASLALLRQLPPALCWSPDPRAIAIASDEDLRLYVLAHGDAPDALEGS